MQGTYSHIPETNYVPREHGVAAILLFLFRVLISLLAVLNLLYFYIYYYYYYYYYYYLDFRCSKMWGLFLYILLFNMPDKNSFLSSSFKFWLIKYKD